MIQIKILYKNSTNNMDEEFEKCIKSSIIRMNMFWTQSIVKFLL